MHRYGLIDSDYGRRLRTGATHGPIYMLNLTKYLPEVDYAASDRREANGQETEGRYAPLGVLASIGATLCFVADVVAGAGDWHRVAVVGYPSRHAFIQMSMRQDFIDWHHNKSAGIERAIVMGTLPTLRLPDRARTSRILLEAWAGSVPEPLVAGPATTFDVEGTIVGDGRQWSGVRYTPIEPGTPLPLEPAAPAYEALLLEPMIERWR